MTTTRAASPVQALLERLHARHAPNRSGDVASYIPELATADPDWFGIAMVTADGTIYEVGDTRQEFTIQSISKPLTYALALQAVGEEEVREHVNVEPSGEAFNSITLDPVTGIPRNPMVNAGAIATTSLIRPIGFDRPIDRMLNEYSAFAGRDLEVDEAVFESESKTGNRNRAIAYLLKSAGVIEEENVEEVVETYFRQCSTLVDCRDLAVIAATLASTGVSPISGEQVLREDTVRNVLSVMASCGMYDSAGDWLHSVGLPAKSGVAGGLIAVLPGQVGIAVYSPPLDDHGNSVRGVAVLEELSDELHLHVMSPGRQPAPPVRFERNLLNSRSKRMWPEPEQDVLGTEGHRVRALELQGDISFAASELISGIALDGLEEIDFGVFDFRTVRSIDPVVVPILNDLFDLYIESGAELALSSVRHHPELIESLNGHRTDAGRLPVRILGDLDQALEWAERGLIERYGKPGQEEQELSLARHGATIGMSPDQIQLLARNLERRRYEAGSVIYGESAADVNEMLLVTGGKISILLEDEEGELHRFSTLTPGMTLGEVGMLSGQERMGTSTADSVVTAYALDHEGLTKLRAADPELVAIFFENLIKLFSIRIGNMRSSLLN